MIKTKLMVYILVCIFSSNLYAVDKYIKGKVEYIRVHNELQTYWSPPLFWFSLVGVSSAGGCATWVGDKVLFAGDSDQMHAQILSAYMAGKEVAVAYNEAETVAGWCKAKYITLGDPPPLY